MTVTTINQLAFKKQHSAHGAEWTEVNDWRLPAHYGDIQSELDALENSCGVIDKSHYGRINVSGGTAQDFLHRMTSAPINDLENHQGMETVVTTAEGRFVDWVTVYKPHDDHLTMVTSPGAPEHIIEHFSGYIFFKEDVNFDETSDSWILLQLSGPQAPSLVNDVFSIDVRDSSLYAMHQAEVAGETIYIASVNDISGNDVHVFCPGDVSGDLWDLLEESNTDWQPVGYDAYDIARIRAGIPKYPNEITDEYTLVEAHLETPLDMSTCFTGQEVIARTLNYDKVKQQLCHLEFIGEISMDMSLPLDISNGDRPVGTLTSYAKLPQRAGAVGLGYVKSRYLEDFPMDVQIRMDETHVAGKVTAQTDAR
ncbi:MAG: hypothetical protein K9N46_09665 [Candidatus Marinimicrobia bacterium]|nr:hypothetical protein [Candidatus Neomarinimicrobiota bacterium]MCF7828414.1 hypothetical protein [Candidatus Neomarinimicrobiota bacterium]MCF7880992.1 hypothetical protein [Candidatus Neomarinimicrobiota bacterium]